MPSLAELEDRSYRALMAREAAYAREVQIVLRDALDEMRLQMSRLYERYAVNGVLTNAEMTKYNRLATAEKQLVATLNPALKRSLRVIDRLRPEQYDAAFFHYAWAVDNAAGVRVAWGVLNRDVILENLANPFDKLSAKRWPMNARLGIRSALNQGLSLGKSYTRMIADIKKVVDATNAHAIVMIRTEGQRAISLGQDDAYTRAREKGIEGTIFWDATLDGRTRPEHQALDGKPRDEEKGGWWVPRLGQWVPGPLQSGDAAFDCQCRCRERFEIEDYAPQVRRSREEGVIPYQTFEDWDKGRKHAA